MFLNYSSIVSLPLGWHFSYSQNSDHSLIRLYGNVHWLALSQFSNKENLKDTISGYTHDNKEILIRGCNSITSNQIKQQLEFTLPFGREAILSFKGNHFNKKSLRKVINRGGKFGKVEEFQPTSNNIKLLNELKNNSTHSSEPQLENLFNSHFKSGMRIFAFSGRNKILAALLLSENSSEKIQTELILRRTNSPIGIMECLIYETFQLLKVENYRFFSLGEVPFYLKEHKQNTFIIKSLNRLKRYLKFAYNFEGLYNFKNKFSPIWHDLFICSSKKINMLDLLMIAYQSNFLSLLAYKANKILNRKIKRLAAAKTLYKILLSCLQT